MYFYYFKQSLTFMSSSLVENESYIKPADGAVCLRKQDNTRLK